jgi:hypothetical protein
MKNLDSHNIFMVYDDECLVYDLINPDGSIIGFISVDDMIGIRNIDSDAVLKYVDQHSSLVDRKLFISNEKFRNDLSLSEFLNSFRVEPDRLAA